MIQYYVVRNAKLVINLETAKFIVIKISELTRILSQLAFMLRGLSSELWFKSVVSLVSYLSIVR